jgi:hypothetical protein
MRQVLCTITGNVVKDRSQIRGLKNPAASCREASTARNAVFFWIHSLFGSALPELPAFPHSGAGGEGRLL